MAGDVPGARINASIHVAVDGMVVSLDAEKAADAVLEGNPNASGRAISKTSDLRYITKETNTVHRP